jgi:uncharacterized protein (DUF433 family)
MAQTTRNAAVRSGPQIATGRDRKRPGRAFRPGVDFESFVTTLRRALVPASPLENILADRLILAAWRLQLASALEFDSALAGEAPEPLSRETFDAERSLGKVLELLEASRATRLGRDDRPSAAPTPDEADFAYAPPYDEADYSNEWPALPDHDAGEAEEDDEEAEDARMSPRWQDRLVFDFNVSETSPVVKGTWVTVGHVVSLIVDGWTWADVLRTHPELTEDDVRTCLAYSVEHDHSDGC